jgi:hypothetical protein
LRPTNASLRDGNRDWQGYTSRRSVIGFALVFLSSYLILFSGMSRRPIVYDEGLVLTAAMRVAAGQVPHRDFYANYGPAQFYLIAGLFRLFSESLLVERIVDFVLKGLIVASVFSIASAYCRRPVATCTAILSTAWFFGLSGSGSTIIPVSLLNVVACVLILPVFAGRLSSGRMLAAGAVAGVATLFRYDTGVALIGIHLSVFVIATYFKGESNWIRAIAIAFWPYLLGFAIITLPPAIYYLSVAPLQFFVQDIIVYSVKYYRAGRSLPFPGVSLIGLENLEIYLPLATIFVSLYVVVWGSFSTGDKAAPGVQTIPEEQDWRGLLVTFALLSAVMYLKGLVRVSLAQMYLSFLPSFLLLAVLFERRSVWPRLVRLSILCIVWLSAVAATWSALHEVKLLYTQHLSLPEWAFSSHGVLAETDNTWCKLNNPLTEGVCFLPEANRIEAIEFIDSHTRPDQELYVGLTKHDRVLVNDNLIYFATQRMPATRWSHFDPFLQNRYDVQKQMVHELEVNAPPYIVLDSEWDSVREPNESAKSSGVTLLDDYLRDNYHYTTSFGQLSIWQRSH